MLDPEKIEQVVNALKDGRSYQEIETEFRISKDSIKKIKRTLKGLGALLKCGCGRSSDHLGQCAFRREKYHLNEKSNNQFLEMVETSDKKYPDNDVKRVLDGLIASRDSLDRKINLLQEYLAVEK